MLAPNVVDEPFILLDRRNHEFEVIDDKTNEIKKVKCERCDHEFLTTSELINSAADACPKCNGIGFKTLYECRFHDIFKSKFADEYTLITPYITSHHRMIIMHNKCGCIKAVVPRNVYNSNIICSNEVCREDYRNKRINSSVLTYATFYGEGNYVLNKYPGKKMRNFDTADFKKVRCEKGHAFHINTKCEYEKISCPFCTVMQTDEYLKFEKGIIDKEIKMKMYELKKKVDGGID